MVGISIFTNRDCCVEAVVKNSVFSLWSVEVCCVCVVDVMDVVFPFVL